MKIPVVTKSVPKTGELVGPSLIGVQTDGLNRYGGPYVWWRDDKGRTVLVSELGAVHPIGRAVTERTT